MSAVIPLTIRRLPIGQRLDERLQSLGSLPLEAVRAPGLAGRLFSKQAPAARLPALAPAIEVLLSRLPTGGWRISAATARALAALFEATRPRRLLEFGSGVSTVLFAALCAQAGGGRRVISIEEHPAYAVRTRRLLDEFELAQHATTLVAPVGDSIFGGWAGRTYRPDPDTLRLALAGERVDFVFIDGPASWLGRRGDCRFGTLPLARTFAADQAVFVADDTLRRRDLAIVRRWQALPYVSVRGMLGIGRGLAVGVLRGE